jgi:hypothetical protein
VTRPASRSRSMDFQSSPAYFDLVYSVPGHVLESGSARGATSWYNEREEMLDLPHGKGSINGCYHFKAKSQSFPLRNYTSANGLHFHEFVPEVLWPGAIDEDRQHIPDAPSLLSSLMTNFVNQTTEGWTPTGPTDVDIATDVLEFGQNINQIKELHSAIRGVVETIGANLFRPKLWIDQFLANEFGTQPLIADISAMIDLTDKATKRLKFLKNTRGRQVTLHSQRVFDDIGGHVDLDPPTIMSDNTQPRLTRNTTVVSIGAKLYHLLYGLDDASANWNLLKAKMGLTRPYTSAWNRVKYSFVVDWFYDVGHLLDSLDFSGIDFYGEWDISPIWHSYKTHAEVKRWFYPFTSDSPYVLTESKFTIYRRGLGFPQVSVIPTFTRLQLALAAALVGQRILPNTSGVRRYDVRTRRGIVYPNRLTV